MNTLILKEMLQCSKLRKKMKKTFLVFTLIISFIPQLFAEYNITYKVSNIDILNGYVIERIWLQQYALPEIKLSNIQYTEGVELPPDALPSNPYKFDVILGIDRKRPFASVRIPAFADNGNHKVKQISSVTITLNEKQPVRHTALAAKTTASGSVLASGSWYKVAVSNTGLYKIDYDFIKSKLGVDPSSINSANIRVYGNGGNMLSESNAVSRQEDLTENAIWVNDGGDGHFDQGDYLIFYAVGPTGWLPNNSNNNFSHIKNIYDDKAYYFLNFDKGEGKRIQDLGSIGSANVTVTKYNDHIVQDNDLVSPSTFGKLWWGEDMGTSPGKQDTRSFDFNLGNTDSADFRIHLGSVSDALTNTFTVSLNGQVMNTLTLDASARNSDDNPIIGGTVQFKVPFSSTATIKLTYQPGSGSTNGLTQLGYLDFIEINTRRALAFSEASILFRDRNSTGIGNIASYEIGNANSYTQIWDVTDPLNPVRMNGSLNGSTYIFRQDASTLHEFAGLNSNQVALPEYIGTVPNQNLHGSNQVDFIIVTPPVFLSEANKLANFHRQLNNLRVIVATTPEIYNEFSSGSQDISAIRDFAKMFYNRAGLDTSEMPKNMLLFGDASYDYKDRIANNTNFVPTFESAESYGQLSSFCNDDFFGFLDDSENIENLNIANTLDLGVGRLPVKTVEEASAVVNKIVQYKSPASLGPWRLSTTVVADNEDEAGPHMEDAEIMDSVVTNNSNIYNGSKIYLDAINMVSTPGGLRAPDANKMINDQIFKGTFLLNYNGHGNTDVLAHERIVTQDDYTKWKNINKLPVMVTATCDFGRFDHPEYVSAGERIILKDDGGAIASLTTTQLVFQYANRVINRKFLDAQFKHANGGWNTFGEAFRLSKNETYAVANTDPTVLVNFRKFALLGDPALEPDFPQYFIYTDSVIDGATLKPTDTISALGAFNIKGSVRDVNANVLSEFNGRLSVTIFDKPHLVNTITPINKQFKVRNNIIYRGKATVTNGHFSFSFIAPKDINYDYGKGKNSYYAENGVTDAAGADTAYTIGGYSDNPVIENDAPIVRPYIGDSLFINGGLTGSNTLLYVILQDETGINVSGNSVGHDLIAVLDGDIKNPYIMNDYYETEANTYKRGYVSFPLYNLAEGTHRMTVKAWDVNNNSGEGYVDFEVVNGNIIKVRNLMNYPNPFRDVTHFVFEHNHPDENLNVEINVYSTDGVWVRNLKQSFLATGSRSNEIVWDGTGNGGEKLPAGVYIYRVKISTDKGIETLAYQKLVLLR
jgi:hypothetical protein